ncbi:perlucin-like protein [Dreissena polymorpha]|uniref:C-type lectin domain-containing protein n=1 Tax=Dreissena polymorpha TaxID=45954 RepID=A0A9D4QWL9_DREPO|nr:perlucin-like protein [Dreissena polymorpha]KAH3844875.1 hypothetical protein DPMN_087141 [Dreissena polymorpha]
MKIRCFILLDVILVYVSADPRNETECRRGWIPHGTSCYLISHERQDWHSSEAMCELLGGYLVEIQNADEDAFIRRIVDSLQKSVWTGGADIEQEGKWVWMASMEPVNYANWDSGEPNSYQNSDENCVDVRPGHSGWNDERCMTIQNYVCENSEREVAVIG